MHYPCSLKCIGKGRLYHHMSCGEGSFSLLLRIACKRHRGRQWAGPGLTHLCSWVAGNVGIIVMPLLLQAGELTCVSRKRRRSTLPYLSAHSGKTLCRSFLLASSVFPSSRDSAGGAWVHILLFSSNEHCSVPSQMKKRKLRQGKAHPKHRRPS